MELSQISGLWIILCASLAVALLWGIVLLIRERRMTHTMFEMRDEVAKGLNKAFTKRPKKRDVNDVFEEEITVNEDVTPRPSGLSHVEQRNSIASQSVTRQIEALEASLAELKAKVGQANNLYIWKPPAGNM